MAKDKNIETKSEGLSKPSLMSRAVAILIVSILAGGGGFLQGTLVRSHSTSASTTTPVDKENADQSKFGQTVADGVKQEDMISSKTIVRPLAPIISNLGTPSETWMRLELSLLLDQKASTEQDIVAAQASESVVTFLRTVDLKKIEGPSGFLHFREDLGDMLAAAFQGKITGVLIGSMVVE